MKITLFLWLYLGLSIKKKINDKLKKIWVKKKVWVQKIFGFWIQKKKWSKENWIQNFLIKHNFGQNKFWLQKILRSKDFEVKRFLGQKNAGFKIF